MAILKRCVVLLCIGLTGCATSSYRVEKPDFNTKERQAEFDRYEMKGHNFSVLGLSPLVNVKGGDYALSSLMPVILDVSVTAYNLMEPGLKIKAYSNPLKVLGILGMLVGGFGHFDGAQTIGFIGLGSYATSLGLDIYGQTLINQGIEQFNYDLRERLLTKSVSPQVAYTVSF